MLGLGRRAAILILPIAGIALALDCVPAYENARGHDAATPPPDAPTGDAPAPDANTSDTSAPDGGAPDALPDGPMPSQSVYVPEGGFTMQPQAPPGIAATITHGLR